MPQEVKRVRRKRRVKSARSARKIVWNGRIAFLTSLVVIASLIGLILLSYGPRVLNSWRESRLLKRATQMLQEEKFEDATQAAEQALKIAPNSLPAYHILAETTERQNRADTVAWRAQIARLLPQDGDSQINLASAALRFGQLDVARRALNNVPPGQRDKATYHVVAGWLARAHGDEKAVEEHFEAAVRREPQNDLYQFNLAVLKIRSADPEKHKSAHETLQRLAKIGEFRAGSLRALLKDAVEDNDLGLADNLAQELQMSQQVTFGDYLLCLNFYRKLDEKKFAAVLEKVKPVAARNPGDLAALMDWMNSNGLAAEVLRWTDKLPEDVKTVPPAAVSIAEAYSEAENWSRLKRWTRSGAWGDSEFLRLAYQAYASRQMRQTASDAEYDSLWNAAERATVDRPERELHLARLSTKWGLNAEAEQLWLRVSKHTAFRREALDALAKFYRASNDLPNLYKTSRQLHESSPGDAVIAANLARLGLVLEQNASEAHRLAKEAFDRAPADPNCIVTYAFSLYARGRTAEGVELLKKLTPEQLQEPHIAVYMAVLLLDENRPDLAAEYVALARKGQLFAEEKKLLEEAEAKITPPPAPEIAPSPTPPPPAAKETPTAALPQPVPKCALRAFESQRPERRSRALIG